MKAEKLAEKLKEVGAVKFGKFILSSGKKSSIYVDIKYACTHPDILEIIAESMKEIAESIEFDRIACVELGGVPLAVALSLKTGRPYAVFRKQKKDYGVKDDLIGCINEGEEVVVVEDVTTTGGSAASAVERVRVRGGIVSAVLTVVDREEGAEDRFERLDVRFISLLKLGEIKRY